METARYSRAEIASDGPPGARRNTVRYREVCDLKKAREAPWQPPLHTVGGSITSEGKGWRKEENARPGRRVKRLSSTSSGSMATKGRMGSSAPRKVFISGAARRGGATALSGIAREELLSPHLHSAPAAPLPHPPPR